MRVRIGEANDAEALERLYRVLVPNDGNVRVDPQRLCDLHADERARVFVVEADDEVCGTAFLSICLDPMYGFQPFGTIENLIVAPSHRGRGFGRALKAAIETEARAAKCTKLMLLSSASRGGAHAFFSVLGFDGEKKRGFVKYLNRSVPSGWSG